jgi:hypothetical protein
VTTLVWTALAACAPATVSVSTGPRPPPVCPLEGCDGSRVRAIESAASAGACAAAGDAPCAGSPASECTGRALSAWSEASDERALACVARMLNEACELGDLRACTHAGRLSLDGHGVERDVTRGMALLERACVGGELLACRVAVRWLADAEHSRAVTEGAELRARLDQQLDCLSGVRDACAQAGLDYSRGREGYPVDHVRSAEAYDRGCVLGHRVACNNLGDAYEYGEGVRRDLTRAGELYERACRSGEALGCANLGHLIENGEGTPRDLPRARALYRDACAAGDDYGCLHEQMMAIESPATPAEAQRALERWQRACDAKNAHACTFVGILYEDGPDGLARDEARSLRAMKRACELGEARGCAWVRSR